MFSSPTSSPKQQQKNLRKRVRRKERKRMEAQQKQDQLKLEAQQYYSVLQQRRMEAQQKQDDQLKLVGEQYSSVLKQMIMEEQLVAQQRQPMEAKTKLSLLISQQKRKCSLQSDANRMIEHALSRLSIYQTRHVLEFLFGYPSCGILPVSTAHSAPTARVVLKNCQVYKDCWSLDTVGRCCEGDRVNVLGPPVNDPPMVPIMHGALQGAVFASRLATIREALEIGENNFVELSLLSDFSWKLHIGVLEACYQPRCRMKRVQGKLALVDFTTLEVNHLEVVPELMWKASAATATPETQDVDDEGKTVAAGLHDAEHVADLSALNVIQAVHHEEPAAAIAPEEAQEIVDTSTWAWLSHNADAAASIPDQISNEDACTLLEMEHIFILRITRNPPELGKCLEESDGLAHARDRLRSQGYDIVLPCGAWVFVDPNQYDTVRTITQTRHLRCYHIVVSNGLLPHVHGALNSIPCKKSVRVKATETLALHSGSDVYIVQGTFLAPMWQMRGARSVVQSTTEVHGAINPRRCSA